MNEGPIISAVETVLDNGKFGTRTVKFETGLLARQAAGSVTAYLDDETMLLSANTVGKHHKDQFDLFPLTIDVEERMYAARARTRSSPAGSSTVRCGRRSRRVCATRSRSSSR